MKFAGELMERSETSQKKILLPVDHMITQDIKDIHSLKATTTAAIPDGWMGVDIGPRTRELYAAEIKRAKTIFWNGPMGIFETPEFAAGTFAIAQAISESQALSVVGGGDSAAAAEASGFAEKFSHISTGGGASLEYLRGDRLPGIEALARKRSKAEEKSGELNDRFFYCAGNWKMNKNPEQAAQFVKQLKSEAPAEQSKRIDPSASGASLAVAVAEGLKGHPFAWGGQNCYFESRGAFTGENSPQVFKELGAGFCLVGHSERRLIFAETDEMVANKVKAVQAQGLTPILCVGETLDDRRWNRTADVILRQLRTGLHLADPKLPLWLAYEPVWAIGTGEVATPTQVEEAHEILRKALREWNAAAGEQTPILYGGSVKPDNVRLLANLQNVNGFLIGGASLEVSELLKIYSISKEARV